MPIEIRELVIRTQISAGAQNESQTDTSGGDEKKDELLISESVEQVLDILQRKEER